MSKEKKKEVELPVFEVLKKIKEGLLDPVLLSKETRESCIEALVVEGYGSSQIASLLKKSDRTIRRDLIAVRKKNSIAASPELTGIIAGELLATARNQYARLRQIARLNEATPKDKANAEYRAWLTFKEGADKLHKIGFLPVAVNDAQSERDEKTKGSGPEIDPAMQKIFEAMGPMDRERLIEKLHKDIVRMDEEGQKEVSELQG